MARRRFFVEEVRGGRAVLRGQEAHHLARVLRVEPGRQFEVSDNRAVYLAEIEAVTGAEVSFRLLQELTPQEPPVRVTLLAALIKFDRFEWLVEKAAELGVETLVPVVAERSEKGLDAGAGKRLERWRKIARQASQQARRARSPDILTPAPFTGAVRHSSEHRYFLEERAGAPPLLAALPAVGGPCARVALLTGPEGGWTDAERALAAEAGWTAVSLGPLILRTETAALAALAVLTQAWLR